MRATRRVVLVAGMLAALAGCGFDSLNIFGHDYAQRNGVLYVDGVALPHKRWVVLDVPVATGSLELKSPTEDIVLSGSPDGACHVEVQVYSEVEGDGTVRVDGGKILLTSSGKHGLAINGIRGTLAPGMALEVSNGTGALRLEGLPGLANLVLDNGTGEIRVTQCGARDVRVTTGTGDAVVDALQADSVGMESGTGEARLIRCAAGSIDVTTGTGDVLLRDCTSARTKVESGTGNVSLEGQNELGTASYDLGTGSVRQS